MNLNKNKTTYVSRGDEKGGTREQGGGNQDLGGWEPGQRGREPGVIGQDFFFACQTGS